jgi:hypothetical protein
MNGIVIFERDPAHEAPGAALFHASLGRLCGVRSGAFRKHSLIDGSFWRNLLQLAIHRIYAQDESCDHSGVE